MKLDWTIETEYKEEDSLPAVDDPQIYLKPRVGKQQHSTPQCRLVKDSEPKETGPLPTPKSRSLSSPVTFPIHIPRKMVALMMPNITQSVKQMILVLGSWGTKAKHPQTNVRSVRSEKDGNGAHATKDHVAAMWKIQSLLPNLAITLQISIL